MKRLVLAVVAGSAFAACNASTQDLKYNQPDEIDRFDSGPEDFPSSKPMGPPPVFGTAVTAEKAPPPLSGGTLLVARDGTTVVAADPDRDAIFLVDSVAATKVAIALRENDEPGRAIEDANKRVHVVLRRGGAVVTIDLATQKEIARRDVCTAPRGIAYDALKDSLLIACASGELVTLPAAGGAATRTVDLGRDLRDVVINDGKVYVSRFRSARLIRLDDAGKPVSDVRPRMRMSKPEGNMSPGVAWRISETAGAVVMVHQVGQDGEVGTSPGGYGSSGGPCGGIVQTTVTFFDETGPTREPAALQGAVLPVDIALDATGKRIAVVSAGNAKNGLGQVLIYNRASLDTFCTPVADSVKIDGEITSTGFLADGRLVVQSREPAFVETWNAGVAKRIVLSDVTRADTGHAVFHANSGNNIACASCHPEGGDDGRTWSFAGLGARRTQTFRGGLLGSEPFHWDGDMRDLKTLMSKVFEGRMSGPHLNDEQHNALAKWVDRIPELPRVAAKDVARVARGLALFGNVDVGCASCHSGPRLSNNATVSVGTGLALQVPSLRGVAYRGPFLHNGCAPSLIDRFGKCGGADAHGKTSTLAPTQLQDLVAYLETL